MSVFNLAHSKSIGYTKHEVEKKGCLFLTIGKSYTKTIQFEKCRDLLSTAIKKSNTKRV